MKYLICTLLIIFLNLDITAQKDVASFHPVTDTLTLNTYNSYSNKNKFIISGGVGYSKLWSVYHDYYLTLGALHNGLAPMKISTLANTSVEYGITKKSTIGIAFSYVESTGQYYDDHNDPHYNVYEQINRSTLDIQYCRYEHFKRLEFYYGLRLGIVYWTDYLEDDRPPLGSNPWWTRPDYKITYLKSSTAVNFNEQVFGGIRLYLLRFLTVNVETGILTPYLGEAGVSLIF